MKKTWTCLALLGCMAICAFPAAAGTLLAGIGMAPDATSPALLLATGVAAAVASIERLPQVGDLVDFHVGANDPTFTQGSRLEAEIVHVWGPSCINVVITDAVGERHSRTSVRLVPPGCTEAVGHFATPKAAEAETATG